MQRRVVGRLEGEGEGEEKVVGRLEGGEGEGKEVVGRVRVRRRWWEG